MPSAMMIPVSGMFLGLLFALFVTYRKPRTYHVEQSQLAQEEDVALNTSSVVSAVLAVVAALGIQLSTGSMALGAATGFIIMVLGRVVCWREADDVFAQGGAHDGSLWFYHDLCSWFCRSFAYHR